MSRNNIPGMVAFARVGTSLLKVYDRGNDLEAVVGNRSRWFSKWSADPKGSITKAAHAIARDCGIPLQNSDLVLV